MCLNRETGVFAVIRKFRSVNTDLTLPYATKYSIAETLHILQLFFIGIQAFCKEFYHKNRLSPNFSV